MRFLSLCCVLLNRAWFKIFKWSIKHNFLPDKLEQLYSTGKNSVLGYFHKG